MCVALRGLKLGPTPERHIKESGLIPQRIRKLMKDYQQESDTVNGY